VAETIKDEYNQRHLYSLLLEILQLSLNYYIFNQNEIQMNVIITIFNIQQA